MARRILITGAKGMLGAALQEVFSDYELFLTDADELDITNAEAVHALINELRPEYIINAAAYTDVDRAESDRNTAMIVNGEGVGNLARAASEHNTILVHISTDYVFDGKNPDGYTEDSTEFGPLNVYGESKLLGEQLLQEWSDTYYLVRTSWLYGKGGKNFVLTMKGLGETKEEVRVMSDQIGRPTYTIDLAQSIKTLLEDEYAYGIYHCTNETEQTGISWYDFAQEIFWELEYPCQVIPISSDEYHCPAKRPLFSALLNTKMPEQRNWREALREYLNTL